MVYKDKFKREILRKFKEGFKENLSEDEIKKSIGEILGTEEDKKQLFQDCIAHIFVNEIFKNGNEEIAIKLSNKYLENNKNPSNIVKEKLATFYINARNIDKAREILLELLKEDPENKWTICKYFNLLKIEGKTEEALKFIETKRETTKRDLAIFDIEFRILIEKGDIAGIIKMCNRISNLDVGENIPERKQNTYQFIIYIKKLRENITYENRKDINKVIDLLRGKIKKEKEITENFKFNLTRNLSGKEKKAQNPKETDLSIIKSINMIIMKQKGITPIEKLKEKANEISDEITRLIILCQIDNAYGKKGSDIAINVKRFMKDKKELSERDSKTLRVLQNFLTSKDSKFYINDKWISFQERYIRSEANVKEPKTNAKAGKDK